MKHTRLIVRVAAAVLALLLLATTLVSGLGMRGFAADKVADNEKIREILKKGTKVEVEDIEDIEQGEEYHIFFEFTITSNIPEGGSSAYATAIQTAELREISGGNWDIDTSNENIAFPSSNRIITNNITTGIIYTVRGDIEAEYSDTYGSSKVLSFYLDFTYDEELQSCLVNLDPEEFFVTETETPAFPNDDNDDSTVVDEGNPPPIPQIVVENMIALDSAGNKIDEITEDTPPFTLEAVFADVGLHNIPVRLLRDRDLDTYVTEAGGFILGSSARGTVSLVTSSDYPRFRARFTDITYSGTGNTLGFTVFYDFHGFFDKNPDPGKGTGTLFSATTEEEDTEEDGAGIKVPKIIISAYSYGEEAIYAGDEFPLDFTVTNTSADLALENIVMTLTPAAPEGADKGPGLIVASSSNTIYLPALGPGASQSNSVSFKARPDAEVTSHLVNVRFSYEYQKSEKEGYVAAPELSESIAIPVSQIDRFTVDPIQDAPYAEIGQEAYLTVTFINKGKSPTYNISGTVKIDESVSAPPQHFGNLEAGASDSLDFFLTGSVAGTFEGEVILQYEDDNGAVNEVTSPFTLTVAEPWVPDFGPGMEDPGLMEPPPPAGPNVWTIVLCAVGGLSIAVPLALTLMKRVRRKGREEFDETV